MKYLITSLFLLCLMGSSALANTSSRAEGETSLSNAALDVQQQADRNHGGGGSGNFGGRGGGSGGQGGGSSSHNSGSVPMNSPEPITMIALLGGAAAAGGLSRRRKKKEQI